MSLVPDANDASTPPSPKVPEYNAATEQFTWELLNDLMQAKDPVLAKIQRQPVDHVPTEPSAPGTSAVGISPAPARIETKLVDRFDTILNMDFDGFAVMMEDAANEALESYMPQFFKQMEEVIRAGGTTIDAKGKPISVDLLLEGIEKMEIDFTDDGQPVMPTLVAAPKLAEKIAALQWTEEQLARKQCILAEKKKVFDARRRVRKLD